MTRQKISGEDQGNWLSELEYERVYVENPESIHKVTLYIAPNGDVTADPFTYEKERKPVVSQAPIEEAPVHYSRIEEAFEELFGEKLGEIESNAMQLFLFEYPQSSWSAASTTAQKRYRRRAFKATLDRRY